MARKFNIPSFYRSPIISTVKRARRVQDQRKQDLAPAELRLGPVTFRIARHFGFCFGVENAIEIAYRALEENKGKRVYLLSEMIHNPHVNEDLVSRGVRFLTAPDGKQLIPFEELSADDIVIVPAFGTTVELFAKLESMGIDPLKYNTTCPFVEKVWKRSSQLGGKGYTVIIHGKHYHEETRATFSHARLSAPSLMIRDLKEAENLARFIRRESSLEEFDTFFGGRYSKNFDPALSLNRIGVVNQTTMLASETQEISDLLRTAMKDYFGEESLDEHFADTRDTLCYATYENQAATRGLIEAGGDLAVVVGGYNSSNTSHLVELCQEHVPTYYIRDAREIVDATTINHLELSSMKVVTSKNWLPQEKAELNVLVTAGASCPDVLVDQVIVRIASFFEVADQITEALGPFEKQLQAASSAA